MAIRKKPDGLLLLIGALMISGGIGIALGAAFGWMAAGASFVIAAYLSL